MRRALLPIDTVRNPLILCSFLSIGKHIPRMASCAPLLLEQLGVFHAITCHFSLAVAPSVCLLW